MEKIVVVFGQETFTFEPKDGYATVSGSNWTLGYEDNIEALRVFECVIGAAYMRSVSPAYLRTVNQIEPV